MPVYCQDPGNNLLALYTGEAVLVKPGLTQRDELSALAHEYKHVLDGQPHLPRYLAPKVELACDVFAAELLIDTDELFRLARMYPDEPGRIAYELGVTDWLLNAWMRAHPISIDSEDLVA